MLTPNRYESGKAAQFLESKYGIPATLGSV
jgi:hypothetical protein